jgi:hypothetical protein
MKTTLLKQTLILAFAASALMLGTNVRAESPCQASFFLGQVRGEDPAPKLNSAMASHGWSATADSSDLTRNGYRLMGGCRMGRFGAELSYVDLGSASLTVTGTITNQEQLKADMKRIAPASADGITATVAAHHQLPHQVDVSAHAGLFRWQSELAVNVTGSSVHQKDHGVDLTYGLSAEVKTGQRIGVRLDWDRYEVDSNWLRSMMLGVVYRIP